MVLALLDNGFGVGFSRELNPKTVLEGRAGGITATVRGPRDRRRGGDRDSGAGANGSRRMRIVRDLPHEVQEETDVWIPVRGGPEACPGTETEACRPAASGRAQ